jgi:hypothetical protein
MYKRCKDICCVQCTPVTLKIVLLRSVTIDWLDNNPLQKWQNEVFFSLYLLPLPPDRQVGKGFLQYDMVSIVVALHFASGGTSREAVQAFGRSGSRELGS